VLSTTAINKYNKERDKAEMQFSSVLPTTAINKYNKERDKAEMQFSSQCYQLKL
jgi:hypothetical protein